MENIHNWFVSAVNTVSDWVWSPAMVALCLIAAFYFSFCTRFVQVRRFGEMVKLLFGGSGKDKKAPGISSFQAFSMALSGRVGTGNIVGVATAIGFGGPGAIVWMWVIAFFGAGSAFVESTLAQIYKENHNGQFRGGPAYYIENGLRSPFFGGLFAVIAAIAFGILLPTVQSNNIAISCSHSFGVPMWGVGLFVAALIALIIIGGVKRISNVAQVVAPVMAAIYIILSVVVLLVNWQIVPDVFMEMLRGAVGVNEVSGALIGSTIAWGVKRGIYSNEAGQGSGAIISAAAKVSHPVKQGLVQTFSVYIDTLLVCTATAMMILACKTYNIIESVGNDGSVSYLLWNPGAPAGEPGVFYTTEALGTIVGAHASSIIIAIALFFFAFTTLMTYYYYAETNLVYLFNRWRRRIYKKHPERLDELEHADMHFGDDRREKLVIWALRIGIIASVIVSSVQSGGFVWKLGDIGVGVMAWINLVAILLLSPQAFRTLKDYERQKKAGKDPEFHPRDLGINHSEYWDTPEE